MKDTIAEKFLIRKASLKDADILAHLSHQTFAETFAHLNSAENMEKYLSKNCAADVMAEELKDVSSEFLLLYAGKNPAGYVKIRLSEIPQVLVNKKAIEIQRLYVLKQMIGKGLGKALIEKCFAIARQRGYDTIWLGVWEQNERAILFYKLFGFEVFGSQVFELGHDQQTDLLMKKSL